MVSPRNFQTRVRRGAGLRAPSHARGHVRARAHDPHTPPDPPRRLANHTRAQLRCVRRGRHGRAVGRGRGWSAAASLAAESGPRVSARPRARGLLGAMAGAPRWTERASARRADARETIRAVRSREFRTRARALTETRASLSLPPSLSRRRGGDARAGGRPTRSAEAREAALLAYATEKAVDSQEIPLEEGWSKIKENGVNVLEVVGCFRLRATGGGITSVRRAPRATAGGWSIDRTTTKKKHEERSIEIETDRRSTFHPWFEPRFGNTTRERTTESLDVAITGGEQEREERSMVRRGQTKSERVGLARACSGLLGWVCRARTGWCFPLSERLSLRATRPPPNRRPSSVDRRSSARSVAAPPRSGGLGSNGVGKTERSFRTNRRS